MVPILLAGGVQVAAFLMDLGSTSNRLTYAAASTRTILVLCGLLELRRRSTGRVATWVTVAAGFQAIAVAELLASQFVLPLGGRDFLFDWAPIDGLTSLGSSIGLAVALSAAAGAWRSVLGPLVVITAFFSQGAVTGLGPDHVFSMYLAIIVAVHTAMVLLICRRLGTAVQLPPDPARAIRGARRAVISLRIRIGLGVIETGLVVAGVRVGMPVSIVFYLSAIAVIAGVISGLLGLARSNLPRLSRVALCIAAFGALYGSFAGGFEVYAVYRKARSGFDPNVWAMIGMLVSVSCLVVGLWAIREYVLGLRDDRLRKILSNRVAWFIGLGMTSIACFLMNRPVTYADRVEFALVELATQAGAMFVLASIFARAAARMKLAAATDVFA
jgi:hypothetical protein